MVRNCAPENLEIPGLVLAHHPGMTAGVAIALAMTGLRHGKPLAGHLPMTADIAPFGFSELVLDGGVEAEL
jgi:hypothetical protein